MNFATTKPAVQLLISMVMLVTATPSHAFLGDLIGAGVNAGAKLLGAGIDKAKDGLKDHEAEARKKQEAEAAQLQNFKEAVSKIESRSDMTQLQKEKAVRAVRKQFEMVTTITRMQEQAEAQRRAERDKLFTAEGLVGVAAGVAIDAASTRAVFAQADAMVKAGVPQARTREVFASVDGASVQAAQDRTRQVLASTAVAAVADALLPKEATTAANISTVAADVPAQQIAESKAELKGTEADEVPPTERAQASPVASANAFSPDRGRKIALDFVGSPRLQQELASKLQALGHEVVAKAEAEVVYRIEGEYQAQENRQLSGVTHDLGAILESDAFAWKPQSKISGTVGSGVSKLLLAIGQAQGAQIPRELRDAHQQANSGALKQSVLLVISREPREGSGSRAAFSREASSQDVVAVGLAKQVYQLMVNELGLH
jgi:hypothetical protein